MKKKHETFVEVGKSYPCQGCGEPVKIDLPTKCRASEIFCDGCQDLDSLPVKKTNIETMTPGAESLPKPDIDALLKLFPAADMDALLKLFPKPDLAWMDAQPDFDTVIETFNVIQEKFCINFLKERGFTVTPGAEQPDGRS